MSLVPVYRIAKPYLLYALTPLHAGTGKDFEEHVDLPVQRDNWGIPCIWASSIKGALRTTYRYSSKNKDREKTIFGPEREQAHEHAGALNIIDAKLFLAPTTSLKYGFVYVTTNLLLERVKTVFELSGNHEYVQSLDNIIAMSYQTSKVMVTNNEIVLDDKVWIGDKAFECDNTKTDEVRISFEKLLKSVNTPITYKTITDRIVILPDVYGLQILSRITFSITRIKLDYRKKTVMPGALWDEEYVPESSMFITTLLMSDSKKEEYIDATKLFEDLMDTLKAKDGKDFYIVLGGHETIGKGVVKFCGW